MLLVYVNFFILKFNCFSAKHTGKLKPGTSPWPPFRLPSPCGEAYQDPRKILRSRVFHAVAFVVLHKAVRGLVSEHVMALLIFLLEQAVLVCDKDDEVGVKFGLVFSLIVGVFVGYENVHKWTTSSETIE